MSERTKQIANFMTALGDKTYTELIVGIIEKAIKEEYRSRRMSRNIKLRTKEEKDELNKRIANLGNSISKNLLNSKDIELYKKCKILEFEERTGKSAWGFENARQYYGYDDRRRKNE